MEIKRITPEDAQKLLGSNAGYIYLDVRTAPEFDAGHVRVIPLYNVCIS